MSKPKTPIAFWMLCASAPLLICAVVLPMLARPTNCGGNSAALAACRYIMLSFQTVSLDRGGQPVSITNLSGPEREYFRSVAGISWLPDSKVLVTTGPVTLGQERPQGVVAVCDTPFDNVPRRVLSRAPLTHAVGYSDGSAGLISVQEFRRLDLSRFIDVRTIASTKIEQGGSANRSQPAGSETNRTSSAAGSGG